LWRSFFAAFCSAGTSTDAAIIGMVVMGAVVGGCGVVVQHEATRPA
jgi:hypothetical protein